MQLFTSLLALGGLCITYASATALTYKLDANEKACFFAHNPTAGNKIAFYFAVQSGGSFDVDYTVTSPASKIVMSEPKQRQGDFVFTGQEVGDYSFCFNNEMSTFQEKLVDFEIAIENDSTHPSHLRASLPSKAGSDPDTHNALEESIVKIQGQLSTVSRMQKYFRTRENRNFSTVRSTEKRILNFSLIEVAMMVGMAGLQVLVVRFFFQGARKGYV